MGWPKNLQAFAGRWTLHRTITDRRGGPDGRFDGVAELRPDAEGLLYEETGQLHLGQAAPFHATRRYLWRADAGGVLVSFEDGRPFHRIALGRAQARDSHDCPPDIYRVSYDFSRWPHWLACWDVTGPRKDYRMVSDYGRG